MNWSTSTVERYVETLNGVVLDSAAGMNVHGGDARLLGRK